MDRNAYRRLFGRGSLLVVTALLALVTPAVAAIVEVSDCDTLATAAASTRYRLVGDVDCSGREGQALTLPVGGMVELRDHTLHGVEIQCGGTCKIVGPGTIDGAGIVGTGRLILRSVTVQGSLGDGVVAINRNGKGKVTIIDSTIAGSAGNGVTFDRRASVIRSNVVGNALHGVAVSQDARNDCARGRVIAKASRFADNGRDGDCGPAEVCADVATCTAREAKLSATTCEHSRQLGSGMPGSSCGVCDFD
jgi:hypothetical protein